LAVKFATYNIQYGYGQDGVYDLSRIADGISGSDIICLQEVTTNWPVCNGDDQPTMLMDALNMYGVYAPAFEIDGSQPDENGRIIHRRGGFGNMVLSRWPIYYSRAHSLPRPKTEIPAELRPRIDFPRLALETMIVADGVPLRVISLHLSHLPGGQRQAQISALENLVASLPQEAAMWDDHPSIAAWSGGHPAPPVPATTLMFGDYNFEPQDPEYSQITNFMIDGWKESATRLSDDASCTHKDGRISRLDYLFATSDMKRKIEMANVDQENKSSDHFPVYFTIEV
jgi:endonuclease/exonuclease/phosphatase family metal-dependent hydrolase